MPRRIIGLLILLLLWTAHAFPQSTPAHVELFGGYTYINPDFTLVSPNGVNGWNVSANIKAPHGLGVVADFSGFYSSYTYRQDGQDITFSGQAYTFLFGPQYSIQRGRFVPFARFLLGAVHVTPQSYPGGSSNFFRSNNGLSLATGGGLDYYLTHHLALRGQIDWLYTGLTPLGGGDPGVNYIKNRNVARISTGIVFRF